MNSETQERLNELKSVIQEKDDEELKNLARHQWFADPEEARIDAVYRFLRKWKGSEDSDDFEEVITSCFDDLCCGVNKLVDVRTDGEGDVETYSEYWQMQLDIAAGGDQYTGTPFDGLTRPESWYSDDWSERRVDDDAEEYPGQIEYLLQKYDEKTKVFVFNGVGELLGRGADFDDAVGNAEVRLNRELAIDSLEGIPVRIYSVVLSRADDNTWVEASRELIKESPALVREQLTESLRKAPTHKRSVRL